MQTKIPIAKETNYSTQLTNEWYSKFEHQSGRKYVYLKGLNIRKNYPKVLDRFFYSENQGLRNICSPYNSHTQSKHFFCSD